MSAGTESRSHPPVTSSLASEDVQTIDEVKHAIAVHTVVLVYGTTAGGQRTGDVALLLQDVVHLEAESGIPLQERLRQLGVPDQLVTVHAGIRIATAALIAQVGGQAHAPGHIHGRTGSVGEGIGLLVVRWCQLVLFNRIGERTVQSEFKPVVPISSVQAFVRSQVGGRILLLDSIYTGTGGQESHIIIIGQIAELTDVELLVPQRRIDAEHTERAPVTVDILRLRYPSTG